MHKSATLPSAHAAAPASFETSVITNEQAPTTKSAAMSLDNLPSVLTEHMIADFLGVPVERVRKWSYDGRGPQTFKAGNVRLVRREAFVKWFFSRER